MEQNKREIKFRCFATTFPNKPMAFRYFNLSRAEDINRFRDCIISNPSSRMNQFTGLKDKNGKEIYEGDIIRVNGRNMEVFFKDGYFGWGQEHDGKYSFDPFDGEEVEVIGNIYENPELIKEK